MRQGPETLKCRHADAFISLSLPPRRPLRRRRLPGWEVGQVGVLVMQRGCILFGVGVGDVGLIGVVSISNLLLFVFAVHSRFSSTANPTPWPRRVTRAGVVGRAAGAWTRWRGF